MTTQQALEVLKASRTHGLTQIGNSTIIPNTLQYYQALTIAISVMEASIKTPLRLDQTTLINPNTPIR